ncbi:MAG: hypothetical protein ACPHRO_04090, partial [Nannocystaceae bacterium]
MNAHTRRSFLKVEGLGNDFVLVDLRGEAPGERARVQRALEAQASAWCDRRTGIGADGILVITPHSEADATMIVINADGSRPEMCGNGLRCAPGGAGRALEGAHWPQPGSSRGAGEEQGIR